MPTNTDRAGEIARKLREYSQDLIAYKLGCEFADTVNDAIDLIDSMQAQLAEQKKSIDEWCSGEDQLQETVAQLDCARGRIAELETHLTSLREAQVTHYCANCEDMAAQLEAVQRRERAALKRLDVETRGENEHDDK